jgi:insertion element IS1 protein InsB
MASDRCRNERGDRPPASGTDPFGGNCAGDGRIGSMAANLRQRQIRHAAASHGHSCARSRRLKVAADALGSLVGSKANRVWLWLAIDAETRRIVGVAIGRRDAQTAEELGYSLPPDYRQRAVCYTDFLKAYAAVLPSKRHKAVDKASGQTAPIERLNHTFRQRCSRLVRKALSFSKKLANPIGAIWLFIHDYYARILARLQPATTSLSTTKKGFGEAYKDDRSGEWECVAYRANKSFQTPPTNTNACSACHLRQAGESVDFVFRTSAFGNSDKLTTPPQIGSEQVQMFTYAFLPSTLNVKVGTTVTLINNDEAEHTVTTKDKLLDSPHFKTINVKPGDSFSFKFEKAGTYEYFCSVHSAMKAKVVVSE